MSGLKLSMDVGIETYDVEMEHIDGTVIRLLQGRVTIASEVTT